MQKTNVQVAFFLNAVYFVAALSVEDGVPGLGSTHAGNDKFCIASDMYEKI
jgi:hypothetical protein